jgi:TonB family protein
VCGGGWGGRRALVALCCLLLNLSCLVALAQPTTGVLEEWDQAELTLRQDVWKSYTATAAFGKDARGRTVADDLNAWVMNSGIRTQLKTARVRAEQQLQTGDTTGAQATWSSVKAILDEQSRRLTVVGFYWSQRTTLERQRSLWLRWLKDAPEDVAATSRNRIEGLENTLTAGFAPTMGYGALTKEITALEAAYDEERQQLARLVSGRQVAAGKKIASRDRTLPCPEAPSAVDKTGPGDHGPQLLGSPSAEEYYPPEARAASISGDVILSITVGVDGCVKHAEVAISSGAPTLDDAALDLVEWATFRPARVAGQPVESTFYKIKYHFIMDDMQAARAPVDWHPRQADAEVKSALQDAWRLATKGDPDKAGAIVDRIVSADDFHTLPPEVQHYSWRLAGSIAFQLKDGARALAISKHLTDSDQATSDDWSMRLSAALVAKDHAEATASLITLAKRWPPSLSGLQDGIVGQTVRETSTVATNRYELLKALYDAGYMSAGLPPSGWWRDLALLQLERGEREEAIATLAHVVDPHVAIGILADRRFDPIRSDLHGRIDVGEVARQAIDLRRDGTRRNADKLEWVLQLTTQLIYTEDYAEVLELCDRVVARARDGSGPTAYSDWADKYVWILDTRGRALYGLGRQDEAIAQRVAASEVAAMGDHVSQAINLAGLYNELARPKEAKAALATLDPAKLSGYGHTQVAIELVRSSIQLGDAGEVERQLQYLREHKDDSPTTLDFALISAGRDDEAAELLIKRLEDSGQRLAALMDVQEYRAEPVTPVTVEFWRRWKAVVARPDVQAAIGKVGNVGQYPVRRRST